MKFTEGPWEIIDKTFECGGFSIFSEEQYIAFVGDSDSKTPAKYNANLIAAAPDLYEVLSSVVSFFESSGEDDWIGFSRDVLNPARIVLAKVRGEVNQ